MLGSQGVNTLERLTGGPAPAIHGTMFCIRRQCIISAINFNSPRRPGTTSPNVPKCSKVSKIFDRLGLFAFSSGPLARRAFAFAKVVKAADHPNLGLAEAQAVACPRARRVCVESTAVKVC
jgi:hypothetical protein